MKKDRADKVLVEANLAPTRSQALQLILEGVVFYKGVLVSKAATKIDSDGLEVRKETQYVSRGAHKIAGAITQFQVEVQDKIIADVGASTGGFTEFVLSLGAKKVFAIDVGHDQLAMKLRTDPRVINLEGVNIKFPYQLEEAVDLAVVDLSFISLKLVIENIFRLLKKNGRVLALIKPQFEVGKTNLDKNGIVKDSETTLLMLSELKNWLKEKEIEVINEILSPIKGKMGNQEYFFYLKRKEDI